MNKIINELFNRAGGRTEVCDVTGDEILTYNEHLDPVKFAELIVKECIKFCEHEFNDDEYDEHDTGMWIKAQSIKTAIMEHFGVEE